jgi:hypothetical protein
VFEARRLVSWLYQDRVKAVVNNLGIEETTLQDKVSYVCSKFLAFKNLFFLICALPRF